MIPGIEELYADWEHCSRCELHEKRGNHPICFGTGTRTADFLLIGDVPSKSDERYAVPLSDEAGDTLGAILESAAIPIDRVYCTYALGCRPEVWLEMPEESGGPQWCLAPPKKEHLEACKKRVQQIIYRVDPRIIITMGEVPLKMLVGGRIPKMTEAAKRLYECEIPGIQMNVRYPIMCTLSPQDVIKNPSVAAHGPSSVMLECFDRARQYVNWLEEDESGRDPT